MSVQIVNPGADVISKRHALMTNIQAAKSLQSLLASNLGPRGTMKMLVGGAGQIKITKDGKVLLDEMRIQHPTAAIIARTATAQDDITGDGTTSNVLFCGELLKQAERYAQEGLHPRVLVEGFEAAREECLTFLDSYMIEQKTISKEMLTEVARTSLRTKLNTELADHMTKIVVDACMTILRSNEDGTNTLDLHMVEIMHMRHRSAMNTKFIDGLVLDHGARHPNMAKRSEDCAIFVCNISLEYEKSEINASFQHATPEERKKLVVAERKYTDDKVREIIAFKEKIVTGEADCKYKSFIVINQKGIDPISLDLLQAAGIVAIRRAKRRNMERLARSCGGFAMNTSADLTEECLGFAKLVYEHVLGEDKYTFVEGTKNPTSCTILIRGPNDHTIRQIKDAIRDGLRAVKNCIEDAGVLPGGGAFEIAAHMHLSAWKKKVPGRAKLGVQAFADALLIIPKTLAINAGVDAQEALIDVLDAAGEVEDGVSRVGLDAETGKPFLPAKNGIWDAFIVKKQFIHLGSLVAIKLLLVDEIIRAGRGGK